tara:strand:+ start:7268 stop:9250 length:1983 start_codon:yes stop_codon:yes gene_type:complete
MATTEEEIKQLQELAKQRQADLQAARDKIELLKIQREEYSAGTTEYRAFTEEISRQTEAVQTLQALQQQRIDSLKEETAALEKRTRAEKKAADQRERDREKREAEEKQRLKNQEAAEEGLTAQIEKTLGLSRATGGMSDKATQLGQGFKTLKETGGSFSNVLGNIASRILMSGMEKFVDQTVELAKAQDKVISSFRKSTGATAKYNVDITQLERRNFAFGVTAEEAGKAVEALYSQFSTFTQMAPSTRAALEDTTALLQEIGIDAGVTASILDKTIRATGMSAAQSRDLLLDLAGTATALEVPLNKLAADFEGSFGALAKYGTDATEVFKGLAVQAKNSGLEMSQLLKIAGQFDQFDSAGKAVGRLNAILGGPYLNSIDMLNASEEERIEILRRSTDAAGIQFNALNRFEQQAIAAAMGTSVEEAQRLFNMSEEQYALDAMNQKELQELAAQSAEMAQQLKSAFMGLAVDLRPLIDTIFIPLMNIIRSVAQGFGKMTNGMSQATKAAATLGSLLAVAGVAAAIAAAPFTGGFSLALIPKLGMIAAGGLAVGGAVGGGIGLLGQGLETGEITPAFQEGGTVTTKQAIVHPGEILLTGGQGSEVISKEDFKSLVDTLKEFTSGGGGPQQVAVYIGEEKIEDIIVKAIDSPRGKGAFSPFSNG